MAKIHFIRDYERHVLRLQLRYSRGKAMRLAVGGDYEQVGRVEADIVTLAGLHSGQAILDFGCGSGRLASQLQHRMSVDYFGVDIIRTLLKYARQRCPKSYHFMRNRTLAIPLPDASVDMAVAFSVFTHLHHDESYIYLDEFRRVVRPSGTIVFSFLEFRGPSQWAQFERTVAAKRAGKLPHLNQFIERSQIDFLCGKLGFRNTRFIDGSAHPWGASGPLGQSIAITQR